MHNIPNLFLIGAPKTGTTALAKNISKHEKIFLPKYGRERFFDAITYYDYQEDSSVSSIEEYLLSFDSKEALKATYRLDPCALSMYKQESIDNIINFSPNAKFIIILREPVNASISMHRQRLGYIDIKMREISDNFMECWEKLEERKEGKGFPKGCRNKFLFRYDLLYSYELYLPYIIKTIKKENLFIGFYDEFIGEPDELYSKIFKFLNLENIDINNKQINKPKIIKKSKFLEYIELLSTKSFTMRSKLGLNGKKITLLKKFIFSFYIMNDIKKEIANQKVYDFFAKTNGYLDKLKYEYK